jgi:hypothetical protein
MAIETTPLTTSDRSHNTAHLRSTIGQSNPILGILVIIGGIGLLGESSLAIYNHINREQFKRLIIDGFCFISGWCLIGSQSQDGSILNRTFSDPSYNWMRTYSGLTTLYGCSGLLEVTRVSNQITASMQRMIQITLCCFSVLCCQPKQIDLMFDE